MTRRANHTITQSVPTPPHPPVVSPSHLRDRLVDKHPANPVHHPLERQEVLRRAAGDRLIDDAHKRGSPVMTDDLKGRDGPGSTRWPLTA